MTDQLDWLSDPQPEPATERRVFAPGIYENLSNEDYHGSDPIGSTGLKRILQSPAHFRYPSPFNATRAKDIGSAIHAAILEPARYLTDYKVVECDARTSALYKAACKEHPAERALTTAEAANVTGMQAGVMRNRGCRALIEAPGRYELSVFAKDPVTGLLVKCRFDKLLDCGIPVDLKKTQDARPDAFSRATQNYGYHLSAALYMDVWEWLTGEKLQAMRWIATEEKSPHAAMHYQIGEESLEEGRRLYRMALNRYADCLDRGQWEAYDDDSEQPIVIDVPGWALDRADELNLEGLEEV